jgi:hypothetical protein
MTRSVTLLLIAAVPAMASDASWACPISGDTILEAGFEIRSGTIRHVASSGNDANTGSVQSPWRRLQYAADQVAAGDTVCVRGLPLSTTACAATRARRS